MNRQRDRVAGVVHRPHAISNIASTSTATPSGKGADPDRGAGVLPGIAEHRDHQIGGAVDHLRHLGEVGRAVDEAAKAQDPLHPVEVAVAGGLQMREIC